MKLQIILASGNPGKVREFEEIIDDPEILVESMKEAGVPADPAENGTTFEENAKIKAEAVWKEVQKHPKCRRDRNVPVCVMSDDSGLVIDALGGAPGVHSARFMGHDTDYRIKMNAILEQMKDVPDEKRTARFTAAVCAIFPEGMRPESKKACEIVRKESMEGYIGHEISGSNGFGYDPFFYLPGYGKTSAEISPEDKNAISHRGKAVRAVMKELYGIFGS